MNSVLSPAEKQKAFERDPLGGISLIKAESLFQAVWVCHKEEKATVYDSRCHIENRSFKRKKGQSCVIDLGLIRLPQRPPLYCASWTWAMPFTPGGCTINKISYIQNLHFLDAVRKSLWKDHQKINISRFCIIMVSFTNVERYRSVF